MNEYLGKTVCGARQGLTRALAAVAGEEAAFQARLLLCSALSCEKEALHRQDQRLLTDREAAALQRLQERRLAGEPLQYILGEWEFMGHAFTVRPGVLIPRQDTETLAEYALQLIQTQGCRRV